MVVVLKAYTACRTYINELFISLVAQTKCFHVRKYLFEVRTVGKNIIWGKYALTNFWIRLGLWRRQIPDGGEKLSDGDCC